MSSLTTRWSSIWFLLFFRPFLRLSFPVRPVSSSSWRSSSVNSSSVPSPGRRGSPSLPSSTIFPSSSPFSGIRLDCDADTGRGERWRLLEALAGLMRLLRRRRWPEGATALISMSSGPRPAPAPGDWGSGTAAADIVGSPARLVAAVACFDGEGAGGRESGSGGVRESKPFCEMAGGGGGPGKRVLDGEGIGMAQATDEASSWS
jgi:hypothetical protein